MMILSEYAEKFIDRVRSISAEVVRVEMINDLVYALFIAESNLMILYYLPGASRIVDFQKQNSDTKVIHIDEDVWISKADLLLSRIKVLLGQGIRIYARQCIVARIDKNDVLRFQKEHHLQIEMPGKYRYGLFMEGELMAIAVFSGGRLMKHTENYRSFECIRFCSKQQYVVVGGFSKLLNAFIHDFKPNDIMTYVDMDWSDGQKFESTGFEKASILEPQTFWVNKRTHQRISARDYDALLSQESHEDPTGSVISAQELEKVKDLGTMKNSNEYYQVVNCGSVKMVKYSSISL